MIEINGSFFDEDLRFGMVPDRDHSDGYIALLQNGTKAAFSAAAEDIREAFCPEEHESPVMLDELQAKELKKALAAGYEWVAVDDRGIPFAFATKPTKTGAYWDSDLRTDIPPLRLILGYGNLESDRPYSIKYLLTE